MKIGLLRRSYITQLDGVSKFIFSLAEGLESLGHEVYVVTWGFHGIESSEELSQWSFKMFGVKGRILSLRRKPCKGTPWTRIGFDWYTKGSKLLRELDLDVVVINGIVPLIFDKRKIAVNHGLYEMHTNRIVRAIAKNLYKDCVRVCVSSKLAGEFAEFFGLPSKVISLPLKLSMFEPLRLCEREQSILHVGTRQIKNIETSIEVLRELKKKQKSLKLIIVGAKNENVEKLSEDARKDGLMVETKFSVTIRELASLYRRVKALLLPSRYEASSYVVLESMASGTPVVVSRQIPREVVVNGYNGFRIESYNPLDYTRALSKLLADDELWTFFSENAVKSVRRFDHIKISEEYAKLASAAGFDRSNRCDQDTTDAPLFARKDMDLYNEAWNELT